MSKFFTYEERLELQKYLKESFFFKVISRRLDKNPTTISREVRKYCSKMVYHLHFHFICVIVIHAAPPIYGHSSNYLTSVRNLPDVKQN